MPERKNVILMISHDIGRRLGCYGVKCAQTPNLDSLASRGTLLADAFTPSPMCSPARAALFTGRYPHCNGVMGLTHKRFAWDLYPEEIHLAQYLRRQGYQTRLAGLQHETRRKLDEHFDECSGRDLADETVDAALEYLEDMRLDERPFYLQIGFVEGHRRPGHPNGEFGPAPALDPEQVEVPGFLKDTPACRKELAQLDGAISFMDAQIGRILEYLDDHGLWENTIVIFTVDHGIPFPRAKASCYDPGYEVACIWSGAGIPAQQELRGLVSHVDLLPSLFEALQLPVPSRVQGKSYWPNIQSGTHISREAVFFENTQHNTLDVTRSIRTPEFKLSVNFVSCDAIYNCTQQWAPVTQPELPGVQNVKGLLHPAVELYDIQQDRWEMNNLADLPAMREVRDDLLRRLYAHLQTTEDPVLQGIPTPPSWHEVMTIFAQARSTR